MSDIKVSILIPIYNVEKYLAQCLESVINQTLKEIEIICINDGSTDNSLNIINEFAQNDSRIKIINKTNSGYGASMNMGLDMAQGEYIGIVESDDFANLTMFEDLYNLAKKHNSELVKSDYYTYTTSNNLARKVGRIPVYMANKPIDISKTPSILNIEPAVWSCIYKRDFIKKNNIRFLETPGASYQDTSFAFKTFALAKNIVLTQKAYINYRQDNENSSVNSKAKVFILCGEYDEITNFLNKNPEVKQYANTYKLIKQYKAYMWNLKRIDEQFREQFIEKFSDTFKEFYNNKEIKWQFFLKYSKKEFMLLINDKAKFKKHIEKVIEKREKKSKRQKLISVRINSSRVSVVICGKQIISIG